VKTDKALNKRGTRKNVITSFKAYKKKYFPKKYAEEESLKAPTLSLKNT
jgi:hypothetical protein